MSRFLCLDRGNSNLKGLLLDEAGRGLDSFMIEGAAHPSSWLPDLAGEISQLALCSVSPSWDDLLREETARRGLDLLEIHGDHSVPFDVEVEGRESLGADRLCNMAAAWAARQLPGVVVDLGTALTIDLIDERGVYRGGCILPGSRLMLDALTAGGEQLPQVAANWTPRPWGRNTRTALQAGGSWGLLGAARGLVELMSGDLGQAPTVVLTGGGAEELAAHWTEARLESLWTLKGLAVLAGHPLVGGE